MKRLLLFLIWLPVLLQAQGGMWLPMHLEKQNEKEMQALGCRLEEPSQRAAHLFGLSLPEKADTGKLLGLLAERQVFVSLRGGAVRVSPNVYNDTTDVEAFTGALRKVLGKV